jgi:hypothetical protein
MNFVEQLFGAAPDGGTGTLEAMLFLIPLATALAWRLMKKSEAR